MPKHATRPLAGLDPISLERPSRRARIAPFLSGVLLGAAFPAFGAASDEPPLRLRLSEAIENLSRPPARPLVPQMAGGGQGAEPQLRESPRLRLALALNLLARGEAPVEALPATPALAAIGRQRSESRIGPPGLVGTARPEDVVSFAALDEAVASDRGAVDPAGMSDAPITGITAAVIGDDDFLPADELDLPLPSGPRPMPGAAVRGTGAAKARAWGMAPVRWGGMLSAGFRQRRSESGQVSSQQNYEARVRGNSYLVQPYIALVSADFGLSLVRAQNGGDAVQSNLRGTSINGSGTLNVFPQSRFPFQATLALSDSRTDGSLTSTEIQRRRLSLRQDYRPPVGGWNSSASYDHSELLGNFGRDTVDALSGRFATTIAQHTLGLNGSMTRNRSRDGLRQDRFGIANHGYRFSDALSVESAVTYSGQEFERESQGVDWRSEASSAQLYTFASWTPYESKWRGTANLRYFQNESSFQGSSFESRHLGGSGSLSYQASRNLSVYGAVNGNTSLSDANRNLSTSQSAGLSYSGDPRMFGPYSYNWYGSGSFSNASSSGGESQRGATASAGHSLQRSWRTGESAMVNGSLSQAVGSSRSMGLETSASTSISHTASLSLQASPTERTSGYISTGFSDSRTKTEETTSTFQMLNTQLSGRWQISMYSELNSNFTWQVSRQDSGDQGFGGGSPTQSTSMSGSLGYGHSRAFGLRGLRYSANFRANTSHYESRQSGNPDASRERVTMDLDQRLSYRIGRLDSELQGRVADVDGRRQSMVFLKLNRSIGAF